MTTKTSARAKSTGRRSKTSAIKKPKKTKKKKLKTYDPDKYDLFGRPLSPAEKRFQERMKRLVRAISADPEIVALKKRFETLQQRIIEERKKRGFKV